MEGVALARTGLDPIVYVVQDDGQKNFLPAMKFGSIETLISGKDGQLYNTAPLVKELRRKLASFKESDYLLLIGDPAAIAICAAIASERTGGKLQLLKWDRQERTYYPLLVDISKRGD
jgi:hypothetical protein